MGWHNQVSNQSNEDNFKDEDIFIDNFILEDDLKFIIKPQKLLLDRDSANKYSKSANNHYKVS